MVEAVVSGISRFIKDFDNIGISNWKKEKEKLSKSMEVLLEKIILVFAKKILSIFYFDIILM